MNTLAAFIHDFAQAHAADERRRATGQSWSAAATAALSTEEVEALKAVIKEHGGRLLNTKIDPRPFTTEMVWWRFRPL